MKARLLSRTREYGSLSAQTMVPMMVVTTIISPWRMAFLHHHTTSWLRPVIHSHRHDRRVPMPVDIDVPALTARIDGDPTATQNQEQTGDEPPPQERRHKHLHIKEE